MTQSGVEFAQPAPAATTFKPSQLPNSSATSPPNTATATTTAAAASKHHCDILLNNFEIKKQRYRVLLNYDHIVWEQLDAKRMRSDAAVSSQKEAEFESERLSQRAPYGNGVNVAHIDEIIRVAKGDTKSAAQHQTPPPAQLNGVAPFGATTEQAQHKQQQQQQQSAAATPTEQYLSISYAERIVHSPTDCNRWRVRTLTLYNADPYIVRQWHALLSKMLDSATQQRMRVRRLLVFINPYGGRKQGLQVYERHCKPLFQLAGIDASCIISQRSNQIRDILLSHDLTPFDAVCCVGGDGTVAEVINGLIFRAIRDLDMDARQPVFVPKPSLPVAIIPAGSTDTVAYSLHGTADVRTAAIHLVLGQRRGVDICSVRNREGIIRFCASLLSYGYLGDVAAKSEKYRWMGTKRYEYTGVRKFLLNRGYEAEIRIYQPPIDEATEAAPTVCYANCARCNAASASLENAPLEHALAHMTASAAAGGDCETDNEVDDELPTLSNLSVCTQKSAVDKNAAAKLSSTNNEFDEFDSIRNINTTDCDRNAKAVMMANQLQKDDQIRQLLAQTDAKVGASAPPLAAADTTASVQNTRSIPLDTSSKNNNNTSTNNKLSTMHNSSDKQTNENADANWKVIEGKFFMVTGANITCACSRSPNGVSRYNHLSDGYLDLILVRHTSLLSNVRLVMNTMGRNGDISTLPFVETYRTKKFCFRAPFAHVDEEYSIRGSCQPIATAAYGANVSDDDEKFSRWNCDGEVVGDLELTMSSHCQLLDVFMRGPHAYSKPPTTENSKFFCCCK